MKLLPRLLVLHHLNAVAYQHGHENTHSWHTKGHTANEKGYEAAAPSDGGTFTSTALGMRAMSD